MMAIKGLGPPCHPGSQANYFSMANAGLVNLLSQGQRRRWLALLSFDLYQWVKVSERAPEVKATCKRKMVTFLHNYLYYQLQIYGSAFYYIPAVSHLLNTHMA
ncbi:hypothetical protein FGO68_gene16896 [Halteria grandinella]|uniref:Uncharacterized protein n=1 Tax=Halteria grandinella TaxID=5974 RepID=A0A8J8NGU4_HALGN|nr:hypothetical protein FGO68_gene16896 [Halteria grandinella]